MRISHVFVEMWDIFGAVPREEEKRKESAFFVLVLGENSLDFSFLCEGCESKKCKSPGMRARVTRA